MKDGRKEESKKEIRVKESKVIWKRGKKVKINWNSSNKVKKKRNGKKGEKMLQKQYWFEFDEIWR